MMSQGSNNSQFSNTPNREKQKKLDAMTEKLKKEFGKDIIKKGHL
jgi:hypothetical protein